jgi:hypothetical protein
VNPKPNQAPILNPIGSKSVVKGKVLTFTLSASDPDGNALVYSSPNLPAGATLNPTTGVFKWTAPNLKKQTNYNVTFEVSDGSLKDSEIITITVKMR